jgi:hypothetical protein
MTSATAQIGSPPPAPPWQHGARPQTPLLVTSSDPVRHLLPDAAHLHVHHLAKTSAEISVTTHGGSIIRR